MKVKSSLPNVMESAYNNQYRKIGVKPPKHDFTADIAKILVETKVFDMRDIIWSDFEKQGCNLQPTTGYISIGIPQVNGKSKSYLNVISDLCSNRGLAEYKTNDTKPVPELRTLETNYPIMFDNALVCINNDTYLFFATILQCEFQGETSSYVWVARYMFDHDELGNRTGELLQDKLGFIKFTDTSKFIVSIKSSISRVNSTYKTNIQSPYLNSDNVKEARTAVEQAYSNVIHVLDIFDRIASRPSKSHEFVDKVDVEATTDVSNKGKVIKDIDLNKPVVIMLSDENIGDLTIARRLARNGSEVKRIQKCSWMVAGHYRNYSNPNWKGRDRNGNLLIGKTWVKPYIKGDKNLPFRNSEVKVVSG